MSSLITDPRVGQAKKVVDSIIGSAERKFCNIMITRDNTLVIIVLDTAIYITNLINVEYGEPIGFQYAESSNLGETECIHNNRYISIIEYTYILYNKIISNQNNLLAYEEDARENQEVQRLIGLKSADGCNFYKMNGKEVGKVYYFPFFSGFPNLSKPDKLSFEVYRFDDHYLVNVMNIYKKKINRMVKVVYRVINLGG